MKELLSSEISAACELLSQGGVLCYPTEAVFGLGCDPQNEAAVAKILALKQREIGKGLILIAANYGQCLRFVADEKIAMDKRAEIFSAWPGTTTWLLPAEAHTPYWLRGDHDTIAVRVTDHPIVKQLCLQFNGAIVSTSANPAGLPAATSLAAAQQYFADRVDGYLVGELGNALRPSQIKDARTGAIIRI
ncbi:Sua5/YciO/YrdC/YwlC family protein [Pseudoalteromonas fenneropenaei]|uniref:Threonylcarbamoyl-AMP synthase n=1 Tax=Pseudoalteromonas fenneropenaei TaxID=1737459 RepID=A0ABV7CL00_9GAMM